ncbi:MAG: RNA polymerase sigma factor [Halioglobus sp.]
MRALLHELRAQHAHNFGWALACCGWRREMAEDVLQESYLRVLDGRANFAGQSAAQTWFFAVIKRVAAESFRRQKRRDLLNLRILRSDAGVADMPGETDSAQQLQHDEAAAALTLALLALPQRQREVLHLVFYSELTLEQVAQVLRISLGSVRTHYHRGKTALAQRLALEEPDDTLR